MNILEFYQMAKDYVLTHGYKDEVEWCENRIPFEKYTADLFFFEYVYVVLNAGMREQAARKIFERFCENLDPNIIGHKDKREAIKFMMKTRDGYHEEFRFFFKELQTIPTDDRRIEYLTRLS